ncbi:MAG: NUDIX hydrolase [Actinoplanes sp.]
MPHLVRAAGGVLHRPDSAGGMTIALVHRPRYDDWSLPKGKLDDGEEPMAAAVREVREETGIAARPRLRLPSVEYTMPDGTPKVVDYWLMQPGDDGPVQDTDEVDAVEWLPIAEAVERVTYADERDLLTHVAELPPVTAVAALVRHAHAGERKKWSGNDALRPIDANGRKEADRLGLLLALVGPQRLVAATPLRCKQTLEPLAARLGGMSIVLDGAFAEPSDADDAPAKAKMGAQRLRELRSGALTVVCSQGKVMPAMLAALRDEADSEPYKTPKGEGWLLTWSGDRLLGLSRL